MKRTGWLLLLACAFLMPQCRSARRLEATLTPTHVPATATQAPTPTAHTPSPEGDAFAEARHRMVAAQIEQRGISSERVLRAMRTVPRHMFVPEDWLGDAYADHPLPIGHGQTISQPYVVAWMTELLQLEPGDKVLEIGTGSGYQASILAEMDAQVYTVEIVEPLAAQAAERLTEMGYDGVATRLADGYYGWEKEAPFDAIIVTCAPDHVPPPLVRQLKEGGRMVVPVGPPGGYQSMFLVTKQDGKVKSENLGGVRFVPLTH